MPPRRATLSDESAKKLIKEVKKRGCLWNPDDDRYNDRYQMARSWSDISEILNLPEDCLRVKWKNMRDLYKKEVKKYGPSLEDYPGKWKHYTALKFLDKTWAQGDEHVEENSSEELQNTKEEYLELSDVNGADDEAESGRVEVYYDAPFEDQDPLPDKKMKLSSADEDYDVMFLKSLAPYFKQLDPIRKLVVRSKMQDMLLNEIAAQTSTTSFQLKKS